MCRKTITVIVTINVLATLGAVAWAVLWLVFAGRMALDDTNIESLHALPPEQWKGIAFRSQSNMQAAALPLLITNIIWLFVIAIKWMAVSKHEAFSSIGQKPGV
jgi:hypothetical protein